MNLQYLNSLVQQIFARFPFLTRLFSAQHTWIRKHAEHLHILPSFFAPLSLYLFGLPFVPNSFQRLGLLLPTFCTCCTFFPIYCGPKCEMDWDSSQWGGVPLRCWGSLCPVGIIYAVCRLNALLSLLYSSWALGFLLAH